MTPDSVKLLTDSLRLDSPSGEPPPDLDWPALLDHADAHSLTPLLCRVWSGAEWWRRLPTEIKGRLEKALSDNEARQGRVRVELTEAASILDQARVPHIVLKGIPLAERLYSDLAERVIYDHDFLVPAEAAEWGHRALIAAGFQPLPAKDEWIEKHLPSVWRNNGYQWDGYLFDPHYPRPVELHVRLWEANWRGLNVRDLPDVWSDAVTRMVAGREMNLLSDEDTVIHLAMHFAGHLIEREARLNQLLDLARLVSTLSGVDVVDTQSKGAAEKAGKVNWDRILQKSQAANISRFIFASLCLAHEIFSAPLPPVDVWRTLRDETPLAFRRWLAEHGVEDVLSSSYRGKNKGKEYELTFLAARSIAERLGILRFAALPPLGQLMAKYNMPNRWLAALMLPRYYVERLYTANLKRS
jgi:hypothetical protein